MMSPRIDRFQVFIAEPARAITPGEKFSTTTSTFATSALMSSRPRGCLKSSATLFFE